MAIFLLCIIVSIAAIISPTTALKQFLNSTYSADHYFLGQRHTTECPTWQHWNKTSCECGKTLHGIVNCSNFEKIVKILACYCMTESELINSTIVGNCLYTCNWKYWTILPNDVSDLDNKTCQPLKRKGQLCGDCINNHAPPVYSYNSECVECTNYGTNWLRYIAVAFLPLTIFFLVIITFRISASSPKLRCFILICQIIAMPSHLRYLNSLQQTHSKSRYIINIGSSLISIWNLDFFRALYQPFCIHPHVGPLGVLALDYLTAIYPLLLILATYSCIKLHDNYSVTRRVLRPFHLCCFHFRKEWKIHRSLMDAFATFLLLSYVKVLNISFDLLIPTTLYDMNGEAHISFLYYSGTVQMFKGEHIPFAILALFMLIVFNIIPLMVLCCYPCRCFQKLMNSCKCHSQMLHVFMDIFHGCYRTKPVDCRYFSALYLFLRMINLMVFSSTLSRFYYPFAAVSNLVTAVIVIIAQPYKLSVYNKLESCLFILFACALIPATAVALSPSVKFNYTFTIMIVLAVFILLSYIVGLIIYLAIPLRFKEVMKTKIWWICNKQEFILTDDFLATVNTARVSQPTASTSLLND